MNKPYAELPEAFKAFIIGTFKSIDVDGMWSFTAMIILNMKDPQDYSHLLFSTIWLLLPRFIYQTVLCTCTTVRLYIIYYRL